MKLIHIVAFYLHIFSWNIVFKGELHNGGIFVKAFNFANQKFSGKKICLFLKLGGGE